LSFELTAKKKEQGKRFKEQGTRCKEQGARCKVQGKRNKEIKTILNFEF